MSKDTPAGKLLAHRLPHRNALIHRDGRRYVPLFILGPDQQDERDIVVQALHSLDEMRSALEKATEAIITMSGSSDFSPEGQAGEWWARFRDETFYPEILPLSLAKNKGKADA